MAAILSFAVCMILYAAGHLWRDGFPNTKALWPSIGGDQMARLGGGAFCILGGLGALCIAPGLGIAGWAAAKAAAYGAAVCVGFYVDQDHAAGQGADQPIDIEYLAISGITSLAPLAAVAGILTWNPWWGMIVLAGLAKPAIWYGSWALNLARWWAFLAPTRDAAMIFGAWVGLWAQILVSQG